MRQSLQTFGFMLAVSGYLALGSIAHASSPDLINEALNQNLQERERVTGTYLENPEAARPKASTTGRTKDSRITVVIDGELTSGDRPLQNSAHPDRLFREAHLQGRLDKEVESVERAYDQETPTEVSGSNVPAKTGG